MSNNKFNKNSKKYRNTKMSNKTKSIFVTIGMILLIFALLAGIFTLINRKPTEEGYESYKVTWKSGGINSEDGSMTIDKTYMYSSAIKVDTALLIRREYSSNVSYMVYYYNDIGELVYKDTEATTSDYNKSIDEIPLDEGVVIDHARIVVEWLEDDNDELSIFERAKLANQINVYVAVETSEETTEE